MEHSSALLAQIGRNAQENTREQHNHFGLSAYFRLSRYFCTNALIEWPLDRHSGLLRHPSLHAAAALAERLKAHG